MREQRSDSLILAALKDLPRDLPETFERILSKATDANDVDLGKQIFRWVSVARRPLTIEELREAIGTKVLQETWNDSAYINDMKKAVACCGNLVFIEEEQQTVHFTHSSVKQYLLSNSIQGSPRQHYVDLKKADEDAGAICVTYLNFPDFNRQVALQNGKSISTTDITSTVVKNSLPLGLSSNQIALRYLRSLRLDHKPVKSVTRLIEEVAGDIQVYCQRKTLRLHSFLPYATHFWLEHTKQNIKPESKKLWGLWCNLIRDASWRDTLSSVPWTFEDWNRRATNVIQWILEQNHCSLAQLIIHSDEGLTQTDLTTFVEGAAIRGHLHLMEIALGSKDITQHTLNSALQLAATDGHLDVVERLLQEKADVNTANVEGLTALHLAVLGGHLDMVERLLKEKANINFANWRGQTALHLAIYGVHLDIVEKLLREKANVNAADSTGWTALHLAVQDGILHEAKKLDVVERLLREKVNVNARTEMGVTALQIAAARRDHSVVRRLRAAGAR